ncbi:MAG: PAS domain S-box protein [Sedimenticola sp.]|uniref:histidine kinase n=1 Tax=Sedimenticola thiotaurini TaxID=1543721 RepID=A0A558CV49_9GAMM|nr:PAS domain S-box protein [Sedimenticola sp.]TVT52657.1 MAG: PAS domain S-box protein [Sedimenticola thiotaurini]
MPLPLKRPQKLSLPRRIPMPLMSIMIGLFCGLVVWAVLDQVQPQALRSIFLEELKTRLNQQARETLIRFDNYVLAHTSTARLLANHRQLANYLEPIYWYKGDKDQPKFYRSTPPWLPSSSLWQSLVRPSHILLLDSDQRTREIYQLGERNLPAELAGTNELLLSERRVQASLTTLGDRPYLLISETAEDATGTEMGSLMLVAPIDEQFLAASQQGISSNGVLVGILDADEQRFLASSDQSRLSPHKYLSEVEDDFSVTAQSFSEYDGSTLNLQFATLVPHSVVEAMQERVAGLERRQRLVAAFTFVSVFTLVFFLLSERLNRILQRVSRFSQRALGSKQPIIERGNQLFVLEDWIHQFIQLVRETREEMRQQHETEMHESEMLKQAIMETALDSIITIDRRGVIIEFNPTAEQTFGHSREQALGQVFVKLIFNAANQPRFLRLLDDVLSSRDQNPDEVRHELTALKRGGAAFPVELAIKPIRLKNRLAFTIYMHDISNRRRIELEIRSLAKFASESPNPILRVNQRGVIIYANIASEHLLSYWGCERAQTLPLYWRNRVSEILSSGRDWQTHVTSAELVYSLLLTPVVDLGYVNIYGRDITGELEAERQAREHQQELIHVSRLSTMGEMATGLAHELNQPLSAIANYANGSVRRLQASGRESDDILFALGQISAQADRAGEIIKRLRALVGKQAPVRRVVDINDVVREVCTFVEFEARKTGVEIEQQLCLSPLTTKIDLVQIEQVLLNLVRNALDALLEMPEDERSLVIQTQCNKAGQVLIQVLDSGPGIKKKDQGRLFEPFFTTKESGMGMGLVISRTIIEDHKGTITAQQRDEGGTCFTVVLPCDRKNDE